MSYFAAKVCYYDEINKQNQMAYHIVAAKTMSDAVQRLANYYDEPNILDVTVSYIDDEVCIIPENTCKTLFGWRKRLKWAICSICILVHCITLVKR